MATDSLAKLKGSLCLVTGGAGFIGSHLADTIRQRGASVRILDNLSTGFRQNLQHTETDDHVELIVGDASDPALVRSAMKNVDYVFHQAAMASVPRSMREPVLCHDWCTTSTVHLLKEAQSAGVQRFVLASTSAAYGDSPFVSKRESDPTSPQSPYAAAKLAAEAHCRAFSSSLGLETVVLRYFNVFGPRQDPQSEYSAVIPRFVSMILAGQPPTIYGDGEQSRDFVYVADVAKANLLAATSGDAAGKTFNIARGQRTTLLDLLATLSELLDQNIEPVHQPARAGDVRDSLADTNRARSELHFEPRVSISEGLKLSIEYYRRMAELSAATT